MILVIELRVQDAVGRGGELLRSMGMDNTNIEGVFTQRVSKDFNTVGSYKPAYQHVDLLMDEGIIPLNVSIKDNYHTKLSPISGSVNESVTDELREIVSACHDISAEEAHVILSIARDL